MSKNKNYKSGFTLAELTVVLLIIALIMAAIFGGKDLMRSAQTSSVIADITYYSTARKQFEKVYGYLPGDVAANYVDDTEAFGSGTNAADYSCITAGDGKWNDVYGQDLAFIQLSYIKMIEQSINFDYCAVGVAVARVPGTHRPKSKGSKFAGVTFLDFVRVTPPSAGSPNNFVRVLRIGKNVNGTDTELSEGTIPVKALREIDRKIDQPETPFSGRFFTDRGCGLATLVYKQDDDETLCTANFADYDVGSNSWIP